MKLQIKKGTTIRLRSNLHRNEAKDHIIQTVRDVVMDDVDLMDWKFGPNGPWYLFRLPETDKIWKGFSVLEELVSFDFDDDEEELPPENIDAEICRGCAKKIPTGHSVRYFRLTGQKYCLVCWYGGHQKDNGKL